jgi:hypothetical protein
MGLSEIGHEEEELLPPKVVDPALTPEQNFRRWEFSQWGLIPYMGLDRGSWAVKGSNLRPWD